ncbi:hypothetical protein JCGZ_04677 [Jatropha curcas]|uniref:Uncharacterized protein n=1 Tax=Jatropha curcas TaxID=180498 RepID=A0A067L1Q6_JATCU|nr:hypothetical protein JCGZ_04677 [Jatropha curcas]
MKRVFSKLSGKKKSKAPSNVEMEVSNNQAQAVNSQPSDKYVESAKPEVNTTNNEPEEETATNYNQENAGVQEDAPSHDSNQRELINYDVYNRSLRYDIRDPEGQIEFRQKSWERLVGFHLENDRRCCYNNDHNLIDNYAW